MPYLPTVHCCPTTIVLVCVTGARSATFWQPLSVVSSEAHAPQETMTMAQLPVKAPASSPFSKLRHMSRSNFSAAFPWNIVRRKTRFPPWVQRQVQPFLRQGQFLLLDLSSLRRPTDPVGRRLFIGQNGGTRSEGSDQSK